MTRLQKKCFMFSAGLHGLLLVILLASSAFSEKPPANEVQILTMLPANIVDRAGVGGGSPEPATAPPQPAPVIPQPKPAPPVVQRPQPVAPQHLPEPVERPKPREITHEPIEPTPAEHGDEPTPKPVKKPHTVVPDFTPANKVTKKEKTKAEEADAANAAAKAAARAQAKRLSQIAQSLDALATGVSTSGAAGTVVAMPGEGGGEAFVGYETVIYNVYYHAWVAPDSVANKLAATNVKIVVARDGAILSSEIIRNSGERALDRSVERVLREVRKLPPFPATTHDEQRSFIIRFDLESKEGTG